MVRRSLRDGPGSASQAPRDRASGTTDVPAVGQWGGTQGPGPSLECYRPYLVPRMGRRGALGQPPAAWRERRREVIPWCTIHHSPPLETQRLRKPLFYWCFGYRWLLGQRRNKNKMKQNILHPALLRGGSGVVTISRWAVSSISGSPVSGPLAPALTARFGGGLDRLGVLPATGSTTLPGGRWLRRSGGGGGGGCRGVPTATSRLRGCSRGGSSRFPPAHDVLDSLSLLLCCRELLGKALDRVAEEAVCDTGAFRNRTFSCSFMSARHSQRWRSWTTSVDIARPRDCAVTFVARSARSIAARSSCRTVRSWPPLCRSFRLWPGGPAVTPWRGRQKPPPHRLYKHCHLDLTNTHPAGWKRLLDTVAWPQTAPPRGCPCTPKRPHHRGWWGRRSHKICFGQWKVPSTIL